MTNEQHPIAPTEELVDKWATESPYINPDGYIATQAAQWGADQELEACCEWLVRNYNYPEAGNPLRTARRPKPPSLKEQALDAWDRLRNEAWCEEIDFDLDFVRRALEALPND